jgi:signal transduction histidine kinase
MQNEPLVVLDTEKDARFSDNPLVTGPPHVGFYAGTPLEIEGQNIGTLCIFDSNARQRFDEEEKACLVAFAEIAKAEIGRREHEEKVTEKLLEEISEVRQTSEENKAAKAQFLALMSHELRTPLNAVIGFAECISTEAMGPLHHAQYKEFAEQIVLSGRSQLQLIDRILKLTDIGNADLQEEVIDFSALIHRCVDLLAGEIKLADAKLDLQSLPKGELWIQADPIHIEQIILELISNAAKFTTNTGLVWIDLALQPDNSISLKVTDTGPGIDEGALTRALAAFNQLEGVYDRTVDGAGLGLPIVQRLAALHGAEFTIESGQEGGTRATVHFPAYRTVSQPAVRDAAVQSA